MGKSRKVRGNREREIDTQTDKGKAALRRCSQEAESSPRELVSQEDPEPLGAQGEHGPWTSDRWAFPTGRAAFPSSQGAQLPPFPEPSYRWCGQGQSLRSRLHPALGGKAAELWSG